MIRTRTIFYHDDTDLDQLSIEFLTHPRERMLIQVYSGVLDDCLIMALLNSIDQVLPGAMVLGTTTGGEIVDGKAYDQSIIINVTCFEYATVRSTLIMQNDDLASAGRQLAAALAQPNNKAVIVFGCGIQNQRTIFAAPMLDALHAGLPEAIIAGGQAGDNGLGIRTVVFNQIGITDQGFAAVSIAGINLVAHNAYTLSWVPIGKKLTITHARGSRVYTIDGKPPYDIYSHYLGQEVADNLPLSAADFPLIIERDGVQMAIHATGVNPDGSFDYIHHFHPGEQLQFGYCHAGLLASAVNKLTASLQPTHPQAAFVYSCVSRKWILDSDIQVELQPINSLAPNAGFFCYGEYFGQAYKQPLFLSQTMTVLCLAEINRGEGDEAERSKQADPLHPESRQFRTIRVLHRLVEKSVHEIDAMNQELAKLACKDSLTGLYNRRVFDEHLELELRRHARTHSPLSLILLDVDYFKLYNDSYGHVMGDSCLRAVAQTLTKIAHRDIDTIARYGGEEFVIILPDTDYPTAMDLAETLRFGVEQLAIPHRCSDASPYITISLGVVTGRYNESTPPSKVVDLCDRYLYQAKQAGRNQAIGLDLTARHKH